MKNLTNKCLVHTSALLFVLTLIGNSALATSPPTVTNLNPADNATNIPRTNWAYTITFNEDIQNGSGVILLKNSSNDGAIATANIGTVRALITGSQIDIDFNADGGMGSFEMDKNTEYYIEIPAGTVEDLIGNPYAGLAKPDWSFTTQPNQSPTQINLSATDITENSGVGTMVGILTTDDPDVSDTHVYNMAGGLPDNSFFTVVGDELRIDAAIDFESNESFLIKVNVFDGTINYKEFFTITVNNLADATENDFVSFTITGQTDPATIDVVNKKVSINMPVGTNKFGLTPSFTTSPSATSSPLTDVEQNFLSPFSYTISSETGVGQLWEITVTTLLSAGTYTVGTTGDYTDLNVAFNALEANGISGDVIFELQDGFIDNTNQHIWDRFTGTDTYSVTIRPESGASSASINGNNSSVAIFIRGVENLTIDGRDVLVIENLSTGGGITIAQMNTDISKNIAVKNTSIKSLKQNIDLKGISGIDILDNAFYNKTTASQSLVNAVKYGSTTQTVENITIAGNKVTFDSKYTGISFASGNPISGYLRIYNNIISVKSEEGSSIYGIHLNAAPDELSIYHNTIAIQGTNVAASTSIVGINIQNSSAANSGRIENNIIDLSSTITAGSKIGILLSNATNIDASNNNITYSASGSLKALMAIDGSLYTNTSSLSALAPGTTNSTVSFTDEANDDLTLSGVSLSDADLRGGVVALVTSDIDGNSRSAIVPSKGAYEYDNTIAEILDFTFTSQEANAIIDKGALTVTAEVGAGVSLTNIAPSISVFTGSSVSPNSGAAQDFSTSVNYTVTAEAGNTAVWAVTVTEVNESPTGISLTDNTVDENLTAGAVIGILTSTDENAGDSHSYSIVPAVGDAASFSILNDQLKSAEVFNFENKETYSVRIETNDGNGGAFEKTFSISVNDLDEEIPLIISRTPDDDATDVAETNFTFTITYNEPIFKNENAYARLRKTSPSQSIAFKNSVSPEDWLTVSGNTATINFNLDAALSPLEPEKGYHLEVGNLVKDAAGNLSAAWGDNTTWNYTTGDNTGPTMNNRNPDDGETGVLINESISAGFNEPIQKGISGTIALYDDSGLLESKAINDVSVIIGGGTLNGTLTPNFSTALVPETNYYVLISADAIEDDNGNPFVGVLTTSEWNFTTMDNESIPPNLDFISPAHLSTEISVSEIFDDGIYFEFDENIIPGIGNLEIRRTSDDGLIQSFGLTDSGVEFSDNAVDIYNAVVPYNTEMYMIICSTCITDVLGNPFAGTTAGDWSFTTEGLSIVSLTPENGATDVGLTNWTYSITFDEDIQYGTGTIWLRKVSGDVPFVSAVVNTARTSITSSTFTIDFNADGGLNTIELDERTEYYLAMPNGAIENLSGIPFEGTGTADWAFTTIDMTPPVGDTFSPADDASNVALDATLSLAFDEDIMLGVNGATKLVVIKRTGGSNFEVVALTAANISGNTLTIPHADFEYNQGYNIYLAEGVIADLANNWHGGIEENTDWNFTTTVEPLIVTSLNPIHGDTDIAIDEPLVITFNKNISTPTSGSFSMFDAADDTQLGVNWYLPSLTSVIGNVMTVDYPDGFIVEGQEVYFKIFPSNTVEDEDGQKWLGFTANNAYQFTFMTNEAPTDISLDANSIAENNESGDVVANFSTTDDDLGETYTYTLVAGDGADDNGSFTIDVVELKANAVFDFEDKSNYTIRVNTNDGNGGNFEEQFTINVSDVAEAPTDIALSNSTIDESNPTGTTVGNLSSVDEDENESFTYQLVAGTGSDDNASFGISGSQLQSGVVFDFETKSSYSVRVQTTDKDGLTYEEVFSITINDLPAQVTDVLAGSQTFDENLNTGTSVATLTTTGEDLSGSYTYALVSGAGDADNADFTIDGDQLKTNAAFNFESQSNYSIRIESNDGGGNVAAFNLNFTVNDVSESPTALAIDNSTIAENSATGTAVGTFTTTDEDAGETYTYTLVTGTGDDDNDSFTIDGAELQTSATFDFEDKSSYTIRVNTNDGNGGAFAQSFSISINDVFEKQNQTIAFGAIADKTFGDADFELLASASSDLPVTYSVVSGPVSISGTTVSISGAGVATIAVNQAGDDDFNPAPEATESFDIAKADQMITIETIEDKLTTDDPFMASASVDSGQPLTYEVSGPATILGTEITLTGVSGTVTVTVSQAGNDDYNAASASESFEVTDPGKTNQTITFEAIADKTFGDAAFTLSASASSSLGVVFTVVSGPVSIDGNELTITGAGAVTIAANQAGDDDFNPAPEATRSFDIAKADQMITIETIEDKLTTDDPFMASASVDSGQPLTYEVSGPATISGTEITLTGVSGTVTVTVSQAGNDDYNAAEVSVSFEVVEETVTAVEDLSLSIGVYPNPSSGVFRLQSEANVEQILIYDFRGARVFEKALNVGSEEINLSHLPKGIYLLVGYTGQESFQRKIQLY